MDGNLKLITPPVIEPVTIDEVKLQSHIDEDIEDTLLATWIASARRQAEVYQRRSYITQTWELSFDKFPALPVLLPRSPVQVVVKFSYYDYQNIEKEIVSTDLLIDTDSQPARVTLSYGVRYPAVMLREMNAVKIRYTAGYGDSADDVPQNVKDAIMLYCGFRNANRAAESSDGGISNPLLSAVPPQFYDLLRTERIHL